jgi:ribosomal protein S27AE
VTVTRVDMGGNEVPDDWRSCWSCGGAGVVPKHGLSPRFKCGPCCGLGYIPPEQPGPPSKESAEATRAFIESLRAESETTP